MKKLSLYIHIPFCERKCLYCDFLSMDNCTYECKRTYVDALIREIASYGLKASESMVETIFIGGGTPSCLQEGWITKIMEAVREAFCVSERAEITIEVNPGTLDQRKAVEYRKAGINRMSLGLQSADPKELAMLGRIHNYDQFLASYSQARDAGFRNINVDLMMGLPHQTVAGLGKTLDKVLRLKPEHISLYSLQIEEGTALANRQDLVMAVPEEEVDRNMYHFAKKYLVPMGYGRYEISNYAKEGYACRHNCVYWTCGEYLGMGLGASSYVDGVRYSNITDLDAYIQLALSGDCTAIHENHIPDTETSRMEEFMFLGLRMDRGIRETEFHDRFGKELYGVYGDVIRRHEAAGLVESGKGYIKLTERGIDVSNQVLCEYLF